MTLVHFEVLTKQCVPCQVSLSIQLACIKRDTGPQGGYAVKARGIVTYRVPGPSRCDMFAMDGRTLDRSTACLVAVSARHMRIGAPSGAEAVAADAFGGQQEVVLFGNPAAAAPELDGIAGTFAQADAVQIDVQGHFVEAGLCELAGHGAVVPVADVGLLAVLGHYEQHEVALGLTAVQVIVVDYLHVGTSAEAAFEGIPEGLRTLVEDQATGDDIGEPASTVAQTASHRFGWGWAGVSDVCHGAR
jgi:hypothetical protein